MSNIFTDGRVFPTSAISLTCCFPHYKVINEGRGRDTEYTPGAVLIKQLVLQ